MNPVPVLSIRDLDVSYGIARVIRKVSINVTERSAVAIVGPNGAGKSTLMKAVAGGIRAAAGDIHVIGRSVLGMRPESIAALGVAHVPEGRHVFSSLSVAENLMVGGTMLPHRRDMHREMERVLHYFPRLAERLQQSAGKLSGGEQQMLVIGRALMGRPRILLLDEPSLGLAPKIIDEVYAIVKSLREEEKITLLVNEQNTSRVIRFMDEVHVLREGSIKLSAKTADVRDGDSIKEAYFGLHRKQAS